MRVEVHVETTKRHHKYITAVTLCANVNITTSEDKVVEQNCLGYAEGDVELPKHPICLQAV